MVIEDKPPEIEQVLRKVKKNIFNLALGNRNSRTSIKSRENTSFNNTEPSPVPVATVTVPAPEPEEIKKDETKDF